MRKFSGRTDILSPLLQERQKPVKKNSMRLKSSVPPAPFVAFSPRTVKVPRNLFSAGCSQQLRGRQVRVSQPLSSALSLCPQVCSNLERAEPETLSQRGLYHNAKSTQHPSTGKDVLCCRRQERQAAPSDALQGVCSAACACSSTQRAAVLLLEGNRRILQTKQGRQPCSNENSSIS